MFTRANPKVRYPAIGTLFTLDKTFPSSCNCSNCWLLLSSLVVVLGAGKEVARALRRMRRRTEEANSLETRILESDQSSCYILQWTECIWTIRLVSFITKHDIFRKMVGNCTNSFNWQTLLHRFDRYSGCGYYRRADVLPEQGWRLMRTTVGGESGGADAREGAVTWFVLPPSQREGGGAKIYATYAEGRNAMPSWMSWIGFAWQPFTLSVTVAGENNGIRYLVSCFSSDTLPMTAAYPRRPKTRLSEKT